jgi:transposase-like protein
MVLLPVRGPHCHSEPIMKGGTTTTGTQRYQCRNAPCPHYAFQLDLIDQGRCPALKAHIVDMALQESGRQATARVLLSSPPTVLNERKKPPHR